MMDQRKINVAGIMTGNSLDAVDVATFRTTLNGGQVDNFEQVGFHSEPCSDQLKSLVLDLKEKFKASEGRVTASNEESLAQTCGLYHENVNRAIAAAREILIAEGGSDIDLIGFHGQTLGHVPPSVAGKEQQPYTLQLVDGGAIADRQKVVTVADFRSDDLLNGGEGAPFAPGFNALLAATLGVETAVFINAGNTSNIAVIKSSTLDVLGWDCGPCNQFPDLLMREEKKLAADTDGAIALNGKVRADLIEKLWDTAVTRADGTNALDIEGPRSFDPQWYKLPAELRDSAVPFEDRVRSTVAFSAYCVAHSLARAVEQGYRPETILLFGGGWKNPALILELKELCAGKAQYILPRHAELFKSLQNVIPNPDAIIKLSDEAGLPNSGMEAGIFAFAAIQRILDQPFTRPSFTNCKSPTRCGAVFMPGTGEASPALAGLDLFDQRELFKDKRVGRAAPDNQL